MLEKVKKKSFDKFIDVYNIMQIGVEHNKEDFIIRYDRKKYDCVYIDLEEDRTWEEYEEKTNN